MSAPELLFLLLPIAALSGWLIGRRGSRRSSDKANCPSLSADYFKGLNYLLNEQSDKALEIFVQMSTPDSDTVELHFALASLFARRGEVDRAIRIHQNLIARPLLSRTDRQHALYELAHDYMRAGLLDRAENLFTELLDDAAFGRQSRLQLLEIYQQEKEWERAIETVRRVGGERGKSLGKLTAHFYCELAEAALGVGDATQAMRLVKQAFGESKLSVRASLIEARIQLHNKNPRAAIKSLKGVAAANGEYLPLLLEPLQQAYEQLGEMDEYLVYLQQLTAGKSISPTLKLSEQLQRREGEEQAMGLLSRVLHERPSLRLLKQLLTLRAKGNPEDAALQLSLKTVTDFLEHKPIYHCDNCGYNSRVMHWQCPSCKQWDHVKPIQGIEGD